MAGKRAVPATRPVASAGHAHPSLLPGWMAAVVTKPPADPARNEGLAFRLRG